MINLTKDVDKIIKAGVTEVMIQTTADLYGGLGWLNAGYLEKASVKLTAAPRIIDLIDGSKYQLGYDFNVEITSLQYYSLFEFEKFKNQSCYLSLHGLSTYLVDVIMNLSVDLTAGDTKGPIKLTGSKFVGDIIEVMNPNPWGSYGDPWAIPSNTDQSTPPEIPIPLTGFVYEYALRSADPLIEFITPVNPTPGQSITEFKLTVVDVNKEPVTLLPAVTSIDLVTGITPAVVPPADYEVIKEGDLYKIHYMGVGGYELEDHLRVIYTL